MLFIILFCNFSINSDLVLSDSREFNNRKKIVIVKKHNIYGHRLLHRIYNRDVLQSIIKVVIVFFYILIE